MTPAINAAIKAKTHHKIHEYEHNPSNESYGTEAAEKLGIDEHRVFKTLVVNTGGKTLAVAVVPVSSMLSMKLFAKAAKTKKASMAEKTDIERTTGYVVGGVSPLGQKKKLKTIIDASARQFPTIYVSAGRRGLEIEISPDDLLNLTEGIFAKITQ